MFFLITFKVHEHVHFLVRDYFYVLECGFNDDNSDAEFACIDDNFYRDRYFSVIMELKIIMMKILLMIMITIMRKNQSVLKLM